MTMSRLVLFPGTLGDFICFYPTLQWLRRSSSKDPVEIRLRSDLGQLLCNGDRQLAVRPLDSEEIRALFVANSHRRSSLQTFYAAFEAIYSWTGYNDDTFRENLTCVAPGKARFFSFRPRTSQRIRDYYLSCVGGVWCEDQDLRLTVSLEARDWARRYVETSGIDSRPVLAIAPGSGAPEKNWPTEYFSAVSEWWSRYGHSLLILGPVEHECGRPSAALFAHSLRADSLPLDRLAALLERCCAFVGNDSGTTHLAGALGVPIFALFGPSDPRQWAPWGSGVTIVTPEVSCAPCSSTAMKTCPHRRCLRDLDPGVLERLLAENLLPAHLDK